VFLLQTKKERQKHLIAGWAQRPVRSTHYNYGSFL